MRIQPFSVAARLRSTSVTLCASAAACALLWPSALHAEPGQPSGVNEVPAPTGTPSQPSMLTTVPAKTTPDASATPTPSEPARLDEPSRLAISVSPYVWLTSMSGNQTVRGATFDVNKTFIDIVQESDMVFGLMGAVDVKFDRLVFQFNATWTTAEFNTDHTVLNGVDLKSRVTVDTTWLEVFGGYRVFDQPLGESASDKRRIFLDAFGGARWTLLSMDSKITAKDDITLPDGSTIDAGRSKSQSPSEDWAEPFFGLRLGVDITDRWALLVRGDVGGFGLGSDFSWQALGAVGYNFEMLGLGVTAFGGFRALGQDYTNGGFGWDMIVYGPVMGMQVRF